MLLEIHLCMLSMVVACAAVSSDAPYVHPKADPALTREGCEMECDALIRSKYFGGVFLPIKLSMAQLSDARVLVNHARTMLP